MDDQQLISNSVNYALSKNKQIGTEFERIGKFTKRYNMLQDNFIDQVAAKFAEVYPAFIKAGLHSQLDITQNTFGTIVKKISKAYSKAPIRSFSEDETTQVFFESLYKDMEVDDLLKQTNLYTNSLNDCLIQVGYDTANSLPTLRLRRPDNTIVITDENNDIEEVYIFIKVVDSKQIWNGYTKDKMFYVEVDNPSDFDNYIISGKELTPKAFKDNPNSINPLGVLPFIPFHNTFRDSEFWNMYTGDDLTEGTISIAVKLSFLNHLIKLQSFKQLVAKGTNIQSIGDVQFDPEVILAIGGEGAEISVLDLESNYQMLQEVVDKYNINLAINHGISTSAFKLTGDVTSGFSLMLQNIELNDIIENQQNYFSKKEEKLLNLILLVLDKYATGLPKYKNELKVTFGDINYPVQRTDTLEVYTKEIDLGLNNPVSILMKEEGITQDEAEKRYKENLKYRNEMLNKFDTNLNTKTTADALGIEDNAAT